MAKVFMTKVFSNGGSQAVRIPAELRFEIPQVYLWLDEATGDVRMSNSRPSRMASFFASQQELLPQISNAEWNDWDNLMSQIRAERNTEPRRDEDQ